MLFVAVAVAGAAGPFPGGSRARERGRENWDAAAATAAGAFFPAMPSCGNSVFAAGRTGRPAPEEWRTVKHMLQGSAFAAGAGAAGKS